MTKSFAGQHKYSLNHMDQIEPGLYLGNIFAFRNAKALQEAGITHILSLLTRFVQLPCDFKDSFKHKKITISDFPDQDMAVYFAETNEFIEEALRLRGDDEHSPKRGGILVHCAAGSSRSATVVAAYLMRRETIAPAEAVRRLQQFRPIVRPNHGFMKQLDIYGESEYDITEAHMKWVAQKAKDGCI